MKTLTKQQELRIAELKHAQEIEVGNNFQNGELWNTIEDKINNILIYGQENTPVPTYIDGVQNGYKLNDGTEVIYEGISIYNQD